MKLTFITGIFFAATFLACSSKTGSEAEHSSKVSPSSSSPIEGNWILVSNEVDGKLIVPKRSPQQIKMFHDGYYAFVMYDSVGAFYFAGAGPYELDGNMYKETLAYSSDTTYNDAKDWQRWELKEDTLYFYGFEKVEMGDGRDATEEWGKNKFVEKRVRLKK